jgi:hypothetical protein
MEMGRVKARLPAVPIEAPKIRALAPEVRFYRVGAFLHWISDLQINRGDKRIGELQDLLWIFFFLILSEYALRLPPKTPGAGFGSST